jgi:glycosyltransferase involved in cell wall biosynthesis
MRILQVSEPADGGVVTHVRDLVAGLRELGHDVDAVVSSEGRLAAQLGDLGARVFTPGLRPELVAPAADARAVAALTRILRGGSYDVVHTHSNKAGVLARPVARALGVPVVHTPQGFAYTTQQHRPRRGQGARRALTLGIERILARTTNTYICVSQWEVDTSLADGIGRREQFTVIPNWLSPPQFASSQPAAPGTEVRALADELAALPAQGPVIGFLARMHEQKHPEAMVAAFAGLRAAGREFRGALVGDGPLLDPVRDRVRDAGLGDAVVVLPFAGQRAADVLAGFDVYALPSRWEALPIGIMEAMDAGLPVVATAVGGVAEMVLDGRTGLVVPPADPGALLTALERMVDDPELRTELGARGRERCAEEYSAETLIARIAGVYTAIAAPPGTGAS